MMATEERSEPGYLSPEAKRRFTVIAGVLGTVFFLAQFLIPFLVMFPFMVLMPFTMEIKQLELDHATLYRDELWALERTERPDLKHQTSASQSALTHVRLGDLKAGGPPVPLEGDWKDASLLVAGERLWIMGPDVTSYYETGSLVDLHTGHRLPRASTPFAYKARPAVISLGTRPTLATLDEGAGKWTSQELPPLGLPAEAGGLRSLQALEGGGSLALFAELCTDDPDRCAVYLGTLGERRWVPLVDDLCSCARWTALNLGGQPGILVIGGRESRDGRAEVVTMAPSGPQRQEVTWDAKATSFRSWRPFSSGNRLFLLSEGMPGSLHLLQIEGGRVVRSAKSGGGFPFPFGPWMWLMMLVPQVLPVALSLLLALVLTFQMRRYRTQEYVTGGGHRVFASLWQRALAQLVDLVPFLAGFAIPTVFFWRMFSDPETFMEAATFPFKLMALFLAAFLWAILVLVGYSYLEGRYGKTPGKWIMGIRVLGTDLAPCGFGRAFLRNLLTFADGFFSFLVGALLVALTENWQRLGDLAARTIVVVDEKPA
jgi:uncharacterized RDD family membrane protein YckC